MAGGQTPAGTPTVRAEVERLEATVGIEPTVRVLQTRALPLGYVAAVFGKAL